MMIRAAELAAIRLGEVDLAFRRWDRPRVKVGTRMRTSIGLIEVTSLAAVSLAEVRAEEAKRAGASSLEALAAALVGPEDRQLFRIGLRYAGPDPRDSLRDQLPTPDEEQELRAWLDRLDASATGGPWTRATLLLIGRNPGRRAPDLAAELGRETAEFKRDVRKLKEKGLTQSLDIGYRLSPRGAAVLGLEVSRAPGPEPRGTDLPKVGAPASRALTAVGVVSLEDLSSRPEADIASLHGVGPFALARLREALDRAGLDYAPADRRSRGSPVR